MLQKKMLKESLISSHIKIDEEFSDQEEQNTEPPQNDVEDLAKSCEKDYSSYGGKKLIDFESQMKILRQQTEYQKLYTSCQVEDSIFIDKETIVVMEFFHYQNDCEYIKLKQVEEIQEKGIFYGIDDKPIHHLLATQNFESQTYGEPRKMSCFSRNLIKNYQESYLDILHTQKTVENSDFMTFYTEKEMESGQMTKSQSIKSPMSNIQAKFNKTTMDNLIGAIKEKRENYFTMIEGMLALYKIGEKGGMKRLNEIEIKMGRKFSGVKDGNMVLTRSKDKKLVSLANIDLDHPNGKIFKILAWTIKLVKHELSDKLEIGVNQYFNTIKSKVDKFIEVSFVGNNNFLQISFFEQELRSEKDLEGIQRLHMDQQHQDSKFTMEKVKKSEQEKQFKRVEKYVFFDVQSGAKVFEYGGVHGSNPVLNIGNKKLQIYDLNLEIKEIREDQFYPYMVFTFAGDFLNPQIKQKEVMMKWALNTVQISMFDLFTQVADQASRLKLVHQEYVQSIMGTLSGQGIYYLFDHLLIEDQTYSWENSISIQSNRKFDQFTMLNVSQVAKCKHSLYINGPKFIQRKDGLILPEVPYLNILPKESNYKLMRNCLIKDELYYQQINSGEVKIICLRPDHKQESQKMIMVKIPINKYQSEPDIFLKKLNIGGSNYADVFQTVHVNNGDQYAIMQALIPQFILQNKASNFEVIQRTSNQFHQQRGDLPSLVSNMGERRLIIDDLLDPHQNKKYVLDLDHNDRFITFIDFNSFDDIGFFPDNLDIECCSKFLFLTSPRQHTPDFGNKKKNNINLLLIDMYHEKIQIALFKSSVFLDNRANHIEDYVVSALMQSTRLRSGDENYKVYLWIQYPKIIIRSKMLSNAGMEDSDEEDAENKKSGGFGDQHEDEEMIAYTGGRTQLEQVHMVLAQNNFIYYIKKRNGLCSLYEGNPKDPYLDSHQVIFEFRANGCFCLQVHRDTFFIMDDEHQIYKLTRNMNNRNLKVENLFTIREIQRLEFKPDPFEQVIIREKYSIYNSKVFFHYNIDNGQQPDGILEAESLFMEKNNMLYQQGSVLIKGSNQFINFYKDPNNCFAKFCVFQLPDQNQRTLINDFQNNVELSSFLNDGSILVKCKHRFLIFSSQGIFQNQVKFNNEGINLRTKQEKYITFKNDPENLKKLKLKNSFKNQITIDDYSGWSYKLPPLDLGEPLESEKMILLQISFSNKLYLMYHKEIDKMCLYGIKLNVKAQNEVENALVKSIVHMKKQHRPQTEFFYICEIDFQSSVLFDYFINLGQDPVKRFITDGKQVKVADNGKIAFLHCQGKSKFQAIESPDIECDLLATIYSSNGNICNLEITIPFPREATELKRSIFAEKIRILEQRINNIRLRNQRMPRIFHHYFDYEMLQYELQYFYQHQDCVDLGSKFFYNDMIVVFGGRFLKYTFLKEGSKDQYQFIHQKDQTIFMDFEVQFMESDEIINVLETDESELKWLQIHVYDHQRNIVKILTWDFLKKMEVSMFQICPDQTNDIGNHIIKGMNKNMNYFLDQYRIFDLQHNIPVMQKNVDQNIQLNQRSYEKQISTMSNITNQRKVFWDFTKFLGVENASCLNTSLSYMDILLWHNIDAQNSNPATVAKIVSLKDANISFNSISLMHFYSGNSDIIDVFANLFFLEKAQGKLNQESEYFPLQILTRDQDNLSALFGSIKNQSPKSFEVMIKLLIDFPNTCISKMFLKSMPRLLSHDSETVVNYFEYSKFCPPQMQIEQFIPWNDDMDELVFASSTSIIWQDLLLDQLEENGVEFQRKVSEKSQSQQQSLESNALENIKKLIGYKSQKLKYVLDASSLTNNEDSLKRVKIEAIDLDWVFEGDNARQLLELLSSDASNTCLIKNSIKIFIQLMWKYYQPKIIKWILVPYIVYVLAISYLFSGIIKRQFDAFDSDLSDPDLLKSYQFLKWESLIIQVIALGPQIFFSQNELTALFSDGLSYFDDPWNYVDINITVLSSVVQTTYALSCYYEEPFMSVELMRNIGAFLCFFMWVKVFYWMRLFVSYSYYVKLIVQTIIDSMQFMVMNLIIMISFSTFYFILNNNLIDVGSDKRYIPKITGSNMVDSMISIYLLGALGDFDVGMYQEGADSKYALMMFIMATFIIQVVFMNMLIAIMGNTFSLVQEAAEENGLREQIIIMADFIWILDLKQLFSRHKYIIRVFPSTSSGGQENHVCEHIEASKNILSAKVAKMEQELNKKIDGIDLHTNYLNKNQNQTLNLIIKKIKNVENKQIQQQPDITEHDIDCDDKPLLSRRGYKTQMIEIIQAICPHTDLQSPDAIKEISYTWMKLLDDDDSGQISFKEFEQSFSKINISIYPSQICQIFNQIDDGQNGLISINELAVAVRDVVDSYQIMVEEGDLDFEKAADDYDEYGLETQRN